MPLAMCFATICVAAVAAVSADRVSYVAENVLYDIAWKNKSDMPIAMSDATASVVNGTVYIIGGCDSVYGNSNKSGIFECSDLAKHVLIYHPHNDTWMFGRDMPYERYRHAAVVVGDDIYVVGGRGRKEAITRGVFKYSTLTNTWDAITEHVEATSDNAAFAYGSKIVDCGGYNTDYSKTFATCHVLDTAVATPVFIPWSTPMASARGDFSIVTLHGMAYAVGGFDESWTPLASIEKIDPISATGRSTWIHIQATMIHGRADFAVGAIHGRVLVIGGENGTNSIDAGASLRHVEAFTPSTSKWLDASNLVSIPDATFRFCGTTVGESVYIFGGQGPYDKNCDCYPTKKGVFVYNEKVTPNSVSLAALHGAFPILTVVLLTRAFL